MVTGIRSYRPLITGATHMVSTGHYLATSAAYRILEQGGNAVDAGVAAGITLNVVLSQFTSFGGVAPIIIHDSVSRETITISGLGRWPQAANLEYFNQHTGGELPAGVLRTVTPAAADAWLTAIKTYGTMTFQQVVTPALELAQGGFPIPATLERALERGINDLPWPSTQKIFQPLGRPMRAGDLLVQEDLSRTLHRLIQVELDHVGRGRESAIQAVRDFFYKGEIAQEMVDFCQAQGGLLTMEDMARFQVKLEPPAVGSYKGIDLYTCGPWCQGPTNIEALQILEGCDLKAMGHNSADYSHTVLEALKLAFADRHVYYGDPEFVDVPLEGLLSKEYAAQRRSAIDPNIACPEMPGPGNPWAYQPGTNGASRKLVRPEPLAGMVESDTSYICVVDRWGNAFSATPSDGVGSTPVVEGLGMVISPRGSQSWLDPDHPCALEPGKRPRLTPNPALAMKNGKVYMPFGTPGGDVQCQSMVQTLLNIVEFGMDPQQAVEAPRLSTWSYPGSFVPHAYTPGSVGVEGRIEPQVVKELERRGHQVEVWDDWTGRMGGMCAIQVDQETGGLFGAADPRRDGYAMGR